MRQTKRLRLRRVKKGEGASRFNALLPKATAAKEAFDAAEVLEMQSSWPTLLLRRSSNWRSPPSTVAMYTISLALQCSILSRLSTFRRYSSHRGLRTPRAIPAPARARAVELMLVGRQLARRTFSPRRRVVHRYAVCGRAAVACGVLGGSGDCSGERSGGGGGGVGGGCRWRRR